ncbi:effector-associated constant component EACC1 [Catenuloplanes atrovinosus]|uniref:Uncharacterized protein n=1 Tax=Catenuloplanes atrovinosus TaxID=137266 RepID=A0AAE3YPR0_9ACTN|nr:hypothetical protein [Catenuloplanes atrovinosus]MDR7276385.1 hypothetical protein [Catenuloplanes atrovinosus]
MDSVALVSLSEPSDELRDLLGWLGDEPSLRGRLTPVEHAPLPGTLGPWLEAIAVAVGPGGVAAVLASTVITWLRNRHSDVTVRIEAPDGSVVEVDAKRVRSLEAARLVAEAERISRSLEPPAIEGQSQGES